MKLLSEKPIFVKISELLVGTVKKRNKFPVKIIYSGGSEEEINSPSEIGLPETFNGSLVVNGRHIETKNISRIVGKDGELIIDTESAKMIILKENLQGNP